MSDAKNSLDSELGWVAGVGRLDWVGGVSRWVGLIGGVWRGCGRSRPEEEVCRETPSEAAPSNRG